LPLNALASASIQLRAAVLEPAFGTSLQDRQSLAGAAATRSCSGLRRDRKGDRHLAAAAPSKEWGPGDGCGTRSSAECSQRAPARTRRAWRSRSSGRRRRSDGSLAFACNRTCVPKIGQPSDGYSDLQRGLQESQKVPANRQFVVLQSEQAFPPIALLAAADIGCGHVAVAALTVAAPRTPRSAARRPFRDLAAT
jgi:hypothetical protein